MRLSFILFACATLAPQAIDAQEQYCKPVEQIYVDGTNLCKSIFGTSFEVVDDNEPGYTMWFFDANNNPNDEVTRALGLEVPDYCGVKWGHKDAPTPESEGMGECLPWKNAGCCYPSTVADVKTLKASYGDGYEWDRCG